MKKKIALLLIMTLIIGAFTSCANVKDNTKEKKIKIVTTIFPEYDWVKNIVGENNENVEIEILQKNGVDLHSYEPSADDMAKIAEADIFVYVGGHSDKWAKDALKNVTNKNQRIINLFDVLGDDVKPLKMVDGMEHHHNHEEGEHHEEHKEDEHHHDHEEGEHHHKDEADEHVWLSIKRTSKAVDALAKTIAEVDSKNKDMYISNAEAYQNELTALDSKFEFAAMSGKRDTILFGDRFPFFYMADDYGLDYYAAFTGCSAESEASFETVAFLANKIDELGINNVLTIEKRSHKIPETIIENTKNKNQSILEMNSMQSVTEKEINDGITYIGAMKANLDILKKALN